MQDNLSLPLLSSYAQRNQLICDRIGQLANGGKCLQILEAGCGQEWQLDLVGVDFLLTGVDLDGDALQIRKRNFDDMDQIIEGDLRTVDLPDSSFDVIYNAYVLEHVAGANLVMENFANWLRPNGIIILEIPDPYSAKGFITRITPHWFHVFFYRNILGLKWAGKPGHAPYPTLFVPIVSRRGVRDFCESKGLSIIAEYGNGLYVPGRGFKRFMLRACTRLVAMLSMGSLSDKHSDLLYIIQRKPISYL